MRAFFLKTERLGFSRWTQTDSALASQLWSVPEVTRYICASGVLSEADVAARLQKERSNQAIFGVAYWPVFRLTDGAFLGCCGLRPGVSPQEWELGVHLLPAFWRQGFAFEGAHAVCEYAFDRLHAQAIIAGHHPNHPVSPILLRKLGFSETAPHFYAPTGLMHPSYRLTHP